MNEKTVNQLDYTNNKRYFESQKTLGSIILKDDARYYVIYYKNMMVIINC
jgi:hypothetical protein